MITELYKKLKELKINIQLVDDRLDIQAPRGVLNNELLDKIKYYKNDLINFINTYKNNKEYHTSIAVIEKDSNYSISSSQRRLWILSQFEEGNIAYNMSGVYIFEGNLYYRVLEQSFTTLLQRHEILRTVFKEDAQGEIRQFVQSIEDIAFKIAYQDLRYEQAQGEKVRNLVQAEFIKPFNLSTGPLLRASLYQIENGKWIFTYTMHHIISDGWSMGILIKELLLLYNAFIKGETNPLTPLRIQYKDYAAWQQKQLNGEQLQQHKIYWLNQFTGELPVLELASDKIRPTIKTYNGRIIHKTINPKLSHGIKALVQEQGATLFMGLLAAVNALLYRYTNQEDIIIGSPIIGRQHVDLEDQIGFYVNTLALRTQFKGEDNYSQLLERIKQVTLGAYEHQVYPFDELIDDLQLSRDMSRSALFDVMVVLQNNDTSKVEGLHLGEIEVKEYSEVENQTSKFDLIFTFIEIEAALQLSIAYNTEIYSKNSIERLANHLEQLLEVIIAQPNIPINQLDYLSEEEKHQLLIEFNDTTVEYPKDKTIIDLFEEQVVKTPNNVAVVFEDKELTYQELNDKSNQLANYLRTNYNIEADDLIGVQLERNELMIIAILGILKSGGAYVPIDLEYPQERINYIIEDSKCKLVIDEKEIEKFKEEENTYTTNNLISINKPSDLVYVIYTSGSTGQPKGVLVNHSNLHHFFEHIYTYYITSTPIVQPFVASNAFDISLFQLFIPLLSGGSSIIVNKEQIQDIHQFITILKQVTTIDTVPGVYHLLANHIVEHHLSDNFNHIKQIFIGGDSIPDNLLHKLSKIFSSATIRVTYGPTEGTIFCTHLVYKPGVIKFETKGSIIGKPIANTTIYILNEQHKLSPIGIVGEICISGGGLARGYLNQPELTSEKFISNPFKSGERIYKTGDLGRWMPDGNIEFIGRKDDQVKIRGYRIELGEIENALQNHSNIDAAVIVAKSNGQGEKELVAYIVSKENLNSTDVRAYLSNSLPAYMLPSYFVQLDELPLTPNRKIDKKALPNPEGLGISSGAEYIAPRNETEERLVQIWQEILGKAKIGVKDNFFELGGHSLMVAQVINRISKILGKGISFKEFFQNPTIEGLSKKLQIEQYTPIPKIIEAESYPLTSSQKRLWVLSQLEGGSLAYNMPTAVGVKGVIDFDKFENSFRRLIKRHEILRTYFKINEEGDLRQFIKPIEQVSFKIEKKDFCLKINPEEEIRSYLQKRNEIPFDLEQAPLLRASLIKIDEQEYVFFLSLHHIIGDGWSMEILVSELIKTYNALSKGEENNLPALTIQYKDYAAWLNEELQEQKLKKSEQYWLEQFKGELSALELPSCNPRPLVQSYNGNTLRHTFSKEFLEKIKEFSKKQDVTLFMTLMATINTLLHKYTDQEDIIIGTPIAGREHPDLENQIGLYINTLAIRTRLKKENTFLELVQKQKEILLDAYEYQNYPFGELVEKLNLKRDMSRSALFDVMVILQNQEQLKNFNNEEVLGLEITNFDFHRNTSHFDITFTFMEYESLSLNIEYNVDIYDKYLIQRMFSHFENIINQALEQQQLLIQEINYLTESENHQLLVEFNTSEADYPKDKTIVDLFEEQVKKTPDNIAVIDDNISYSYKELHSLSNQIAQFFISKYGEDKSPITVLLNRSTNMLAMLLGILKSGKSVLLPNP